MSEEHAPRKNAEATGRQMPEGRRFQAGNPGRPKGSRNKLGETFVAALHEDFQQHGVETIAKVREEKPAEYLKVVASLLPKQIEIKEDAFGDLTDDELAAIIAAARATFGLPGAGDGGVGEAEVSEQAGGVSTLQ